MFNKNNPKESGGELLHNHIPIKLVTVHGTGAGDITSSGDKWWQLGSVFMDELQKRLDLDPNQVEIVPFQWENGPNSEDKRRDAGSALAKQLASYDEAEQDYYLIGHSHGGSVIYNALLKSVDNKTPFKRLKVWCTVGTPFLDYRPNTFLFQRLRSIGLTIYTTGIVSLVLGFWIMLMALFKTEVNQNIVTLGHAMTLYGVITYACLWLYERRRKSWFTKKQKKRVEALYSNLWCGLWHKEDEAISALSNVQNISAPIIPSTFLLPVVASFQFGLVILIGLIFAFDLAFNSGDMLNYFLTSEDGSEGFSIGGITFSIAFEILLIWIPITWILTKLLSVFAHLFGRPLAYILNKIVWASIQKRAWGDDLLKEDVHAISSHPPEFEHKCDFLGDSIADPLRQHSEKNAIKTLHKVRLVLGMSENADATPDIRTELSDSINWQELIHTSYFDVPAFIDLLAESLQQAGLVNDNQATLADK
ncbi:hypothetical protein Q4574_19135 [Aliiglaciecola sp. 3_MG-2023]|uniref:hypothetical protein n=1 Tax=unclassified Aliiglaciecola TaxID=2593648 RepID=UPI0026E2AA13|nr:MULTISPECIES: hypothetical protein [unclassified Aliiglaciecola]MDO6695421.1 hypothetical protein [Aliiglaciecola sp. 3_MG-2023]MDO6711932.1 hypothetical protein [Aliiglaciecola sp. 2_MG-2023]MDO6753094.1 hypothetical protein [Aliiglaciecola sp. 1_MG-2023]